MRASQAIVTLAVAACSVSALAEEKWTAYRYPDRGFVIAFPGTPKISAKPIAGDRPLTRHEHQFAAGNRVYDVTAIEFAGNVTDKTSNAYLARLIAAYAKGSSSTLLTQNLISVAGHSALEAVTVDEAHDRHHLVDVLAAGGRVYLIVSEGPKGHETSAEGRRFRDSFKLLGP